MVATSSSTTAAEIDTTSVNPYGLAAGTVGVLVLTTVGYHLFESDVHMAGRLGGLANWKVHAIYWTVAALMIALLPVSVGQYVFSDLTQTAVGVALPIYESLRAVCTPEETDDKMWLQYWMLGGVIFMLSTWVDDLLRAADHYWYTTMVFFFYWLYFPKTQGATLVYQHVTVPYLTPLMQQGLGKFDNAISYMYHLMVNAVHLWLLWIFFMFLPKGLKHLVAILVGTVYPLLSSVSAAATEEIEDDTYWLTYWSVYGVLFLIMQIL